MKEDKKVIIIANSSIGEICSSKLFKDQEYLDLAFTNPYKEVLEEIKENLSLKRGFRKLNPSIDIYKEYDLILEKKSKLSKWEREQVVKIIKNKLKTK
jgi:hypothetical protein